MPIGIQNINMPLPALSDEVIALVKKYFRSIKGKFHTEMLPGKSIKGGDGPPVATKIWDREPEPPLISSLALYLGFSSRQEFELYEEKGEHREIIKRARLRIEAEYERKLHQQAPTGAIFALKSLGWNERVDVNSNADIPTSLPVTIIHAGPPIASSEKDVDI